jgi:hypothetical protein
MYKLNFYKDECMIRRVCPAFATTTNPSVHCASTVHSLLFSSAITPKTS